MKFFIYKLKEYPSDLYAFTSYKPYAKRFEEERDMKLFIKEKISFDEIESKAFMSVNSSSMLQMDILNDGENDMEIIATIKESSDLDAYCTFIYNSIKSIDNNLHLYPLKKKYLNLIKEITDNLILKSTSKTHIDSLNINTFKVFIELNSATFGKNLFEEMDTCF